MASSARKIVIEFLGDDKSASRTAKQVDGSTSRMSASMAKAGKVAGTVLAAGLGLAAVGAYKATQAAAEDERAQIKLADVMRKAAGASDGQIASTERWITAQGKALGVSDDELRPALGKLVAATHDVGKAQKLAALAMDVSAGRGKSLESVTEALSKAQNGNLAGLSRLGVAMKDSSGEALTLNQIQKNLADTYGGAAAKAADTAAGKQKILTVQMQELQEQIGTALLPVMLKLAEAGLKMVDWVSRNTTTVGILVGVLGTLLAVTWAVSVAEKVVVAATKIWTAVTKATAAAQWLLNAALAANPIGIVVVALAALAVALVVAYKKSETFRKIVDGVFGFLKKVVAGTIAWIRSNWKLLPLFLLGPLGIAAIAVIKGWGRIKAATSAAWNAIKSILSSVWSSIRSTVVNGISNVISAVRTLPDRVRSVGSAMLNAGKSLIKALFDGIRSAAGDFGGFVSGLASALGEAVKGAINSALNLPLEVSLHKGPIDIEATVIPAFAKGVRNFRGGLAVVGERGPELVDLPGGSSVIPNNQAFGGTGGGVLGTLVIEHRMDGKVIQRELLALKRRNGTLDLGLA